MIIDQILNNCNQLNSKIAISYQGRKLTYADLKSAIHQKVNELEAIDSIIIPNINPLDTIVQFLAGAHKKKRCLVVPKDWNKNLNELEDEAASGHFEIGILTSGSTGEPKVIWKSNDNWELAFNHQSDLFRINEKDNVFTIDALSYSANLNSVIHTLWCGGSVILDSLKNASSWSQVIQEEGVSSIFLVPSHWNLLLSKVELFANVRSCLTAGEKLNGKQAKAILKAFPNSILTEYYGSAELGHITYQQNEEIINAPQSVGKSFPSVKISIIDQQIHVNSPYIAAKFKEKGTVGDLGYLENDRLILMGRLGRMFNKRGVNVFAQEIEQVILLHPLVGKAYLHSVNVLSIQKLELLYETNSRNDSPDESELWELLNQKVEKAKHPHFLKRVVEIPTNSNGKIAIGQLSKKLDEEAVVYMT
ncbi:long-chain acyl-CoA synthetase [Spirosomataceae bacterium TFI 002]|nr:long-chain acyl-CoA synthetase [Spirosomataceae bacterium TFI 002]